VPATSDPKQKTKLGHLNAEEVELVMGLRRAKSDQARCERLLETLLTEDEADLILSLRRERDEKPLPWRQVKAELLGTLEP
jgi:hypothetical protein